MNSQHSYKHFIYIQLHKNCLQKLPETPSWSCYCKAESKRTQIMGYSSFLDKSSLNPMKLLYFLSFSSFRFQDSRFCRESITVGPILVPFTIINNNPRKVDIIPFLFSIIRVLINVPSGTWSCKKPSAICLNIQSFRYNLVTDKVKSWSSILWSSLQCRHMTEASILQSRIHEAWFSTISLLLTWVWPIQYP